jgi:hypothetical protein
MIISVNAIEAAWILLSVAGVAVTFIALVDARADRIAVEALNGHARELQADRVVNGESLRLLIQFILLGIAFPSLFTDREAEVTPGVLALMTIPVILLVKSANDRFYRKQLTAMVAADILAERLTATARIEATVDQTALEVADIHHAIIEDKP